MTDFATPETRYALSGDVNLAYQTIGDGPVDIIMVPGLISHVDFMHELPGYSGFLRRLSKFARVVTFDKRGQGLSDRVSGAPSLEQRMDDVRAIMDEVGSQRAILLGFSEGCPMSILFAATYPERVSHLVLFGGFASAADLRPSGFTLDDLEAHAKGLMKIWGNGEVMKIVVPSQAADKDAVATMAKVERLSSSPVLNGQIDVTPVLPTVQVPTLEHAVFIRKHILSFGDS